MKIMYFSVRKVGYVSEKYFKNMKIYFVQLTEILDKKRKRRLKFEIANHLQDSIFTKFSSLSLNET